MNFREINRKKNLALRSLKARIGKLLFDKRNQNTFIPSKIKEIRKIIYLRNDGKLGDMIISTLAFREIKKQVPEAKVYVITTKAAAEIIKNNPHVDRICFCGKGFWEILKCGINLRKEKIDLFIDIDENPIWQTFFLIRLISPRFAFGFNRQNCGIYNINSEIVFNSAHITRNHKEVFEALGLSGHTLNYDIFIPEELKAKAQKFADNLPKNKKIIAINPFAASKHRTLTFDQIDGIIKFLPNYNFVLIGEKANIDNFLKGKIIPKYLFYMNEETSLLFSFALIDRADFVITTDTSILHAAVALKKPFVGIYRKVTDNTITVWGPGPNADKFKLLNEREELSDVLPHEIVKAFMTL